MGETIAGSVSWRYARPGDTGETALLADKLDLGGGGRPPEGVGRGLTFAGGDMGGISSCGGVLGRLLDNSTLGTTVEDDPCE